jgi:DNA-binding response OmpR family regulator
VLFLAKPFSPPALASKIHEALRGATEAAARR